MHSVEMTRGEPLPGGATLPGPTTLGPLLLRSDGRVAIASSGTRWTGGDYDARDEQTFLSGLKAAPFSLEPNIPMISAPGWRQYAFALTSDQASGSTLVATLGLRLDVYGLWRGRLEILDCGTGAALAWPRSRTAHVLPGPPVSGALIESQRTFAILCRGPYGEGALLHVHDLASGKARVDAAEIDKTDAETGAEAAALAVSKDEAYALVVTAGHGMIRADGDAVSWLRLIETHDYQARGDALEVPGVLDVMKPAVYPAEGGACWLATRSPGTGFAHILKVQFQDEGPNLLEDIPLTEVASTPCIAPSPDGAAVAIGADNRLEIVLKGQSQRVPFAFAGAIGAIAWTGEGLFVGEAGRIHQVDTASCKPTVTVRLQSGHVRDIVVIPSNALPQPDRDADGVADSDELKPGTSADSPDTDGDGVPDGVDAEPLTPSPQLSVPAWITLEGDTAGQELRDVLLAPTHGEHSTWQVYWERQAMPWLVVYPTSGSPGTPFYLGINPARYGNPASALDGKIRVYLTGTDSQTSATGSPATVGIRARPRGAQLRRILWIWGTPEQVGHLRDAGGQEGLDALAELLAEAPMSFSHHEVSSAYVEPFRSHSVAVLPAGAAARGAVTRQAALDEYVAHGGALLFLGGYSPDTAQEALARWLAPAGIHIDTAARVDGSFETAAKSDLGRRIPRIEIRNGCALHVDDPALALAPTVPNADQTAFAAAQYGAGRIAVLASPSPLENAAMKNEANAQFATALFRWLSQAGRGLEDADRDGIPDKLEDRNGNGQVDSGETDRLNPDTDGDGIDDGDEDLNRNGRLDPGESSPLNPDSDGDGVFDGADEQPLPPLGTPAVERVEPPQGPGEGGYSLLIAGRNFPPASRVTIGGRAAASVRRLSATTLIVEAPPATPQNEGNVDVVVAAPEPDVQGTLPGGFRYVARSTAELGLKAIASSTTDSGKVGIALNVPAGVTVGRISADLAVTPPGSVQWRAPSAGPASELAGRSVSSRPNPEGITVDISPGDTAAGGGLIAVIPWTRSDARDAEGAIRVRIRKAAVTTSNGESLTTNLDGAEIELGTTGP
ncbi:MAG: IPT/TIG domain-containing protein [Candidatus Hydrogenedentes bacterium]|nr:IPT/TIG domain-containing protein [Candidatus Hydrogenedentota bacterium]